jgi:hypothetical protein
MSRVSFGAPVLHLLDVIAFAGTTSREVARLAI